jgi:hypothetical protein
MLYASAIEKVRAKRAKAYGGDTIMRLSLPVLGIGFALAALATTPAFAHHSVAAFDNQKSVTLVGTVKEFQWTNPHTWVQLMVKDASGKEVEWSIESSSPNSLGRQGWKRNSLKPGDQARIVVHPMKDGRPGGALVSASVNGLEIGAE